MPNDRVSVRNRRWGLARRSKKNKSHSPRTKSKGGIYLFKPHPQQRGQVGHVRTSLVRMRSLCNETWRRGGVALKSEDLGASDIKTRWSPSIKWTLKSLQDLASVFLLVLAMLKTHSTQNSWATRRWLTAFPRWKWQFQFIPTDSPVEKGSYTCFESMWVQSLNEVVSGEGGEK